MKPLAVTRTLTKAQIDALNSTAINIVAAPGSSQVFVPRSIFFSKKGGAAASVGTNSFDFVYTGDTTVIMSAYRVDAAAGLLGDTANRQLVVDNIQTSATAGSNFPVIASSLTTGKGFDIKASGAITAGASTTVQVTVIGWIVDVVN